MKWHDYKAYYKTVAEKFGLRGEARGLIHTMSEAILDKAERGASARITLATENLWISMGRPYYDLYPSVTEAFFKVNLTKVGVGQIKLPRTVLVRLQHGHEIKSSEFSIGCFLVAFDRDNGMCVICVSVGELIAFVLSTDGDLDIESRLEEFRFNNQDQRDNEAFQEVAKKVLKIICTISLLDNNPDIIEPLPLEADAAKFEAATDLETRQKLLDKAARRGKIGWAIGKHVETAPGFRHPHFAIRWMGHGEPKTPILRPIKGCIVNRRKLTEVPTGYLDDLVVQGEHYEETSTKTET